jgi:flagellar biosynthesis/type III secretory pathway chaperone
MEQHLSMSARLQHERDLWLRLAASIEQAQQALLAGRPHALQASVQQQSNLCDQLSTVRNAIVNASCGRELLQTESRDAVTAESDSCALSQRADSFMQLPALIQEIRAARNRVRYLNQVQAEFLQRARRSFRIAQYLQGESSMPYTQSRPSNAGAAAHSTFTTGSQE